MKTRTWRPPHPVDLRLMLVHRHGTQDPSYRLDGVRGSDANAVRHWRAARTPAGPGTLALHLDAGAVEAEAWGEGADWLLDLVPRLLGDADAPEDFRTSDPRILALVSRFGVPRYGRSERLLEALVPAVFEQKVTGQEAFAGFSALLRRFGEQAPGPRSDLWVMPDAATMRAIPSWQWLKLPLDTGRSRPLLRALAVASSLERAEAGPAAELGRRVRTVQGIGEWTEAEIRQRTSGDPDAVSFGDYHLAPNIGWAITNSPWDDDQLRDFLEPFPGHRRRVVDLISQAAGPRPRRGPRMPPRPHLPV